MTTVETHVAYSRDADVLWRDTGAHVLALTLGAREVRVLGGGSASLWRQLNRPRTLPELVQTFADEQGQVPEEKEISATLGDLVLLGLVRHRVVA